MRRAIEILKLPIGELTDEEICKAAMHRLKSRMCVLVYRGDDGHLHFIFRFRDRAGKYLFSRIRAQLTIFCSKVYTKFAERNGFTNTEFYGNNRY